MLFLILTHSVHSTKPGYSGSDLNPKESVRLGRDLLVDRIISSLKVLLLQLLRFHILRQV
jgi:hypothetical protein